MTTTRTKPNAGNDASDEPLRARALIIEGRFYQEISDELAFGATAALSARGVTFDRIAVPGALEIPQVLAQAAHSGLIPRTAQNARWDGVIVLGCVIRGETSHYDIVCNNANHWLMEVAIRHAIPVGNGILTVDTEEQALARARGGADGKGGDAARACLRIIELQRDFERQNA
jgi:6,7-dimethyl-8-ribityllumazine synthase